MSLRQDAMKEQFGAAVSPIAFLSLATLSQAGAALTQQGIPVLGVFLAVEYHLSLTQMGAVVSAVFFGMMLSGIFTGMIVDHIGSRRALLVGSLLLSSAAVAIGWIQSLPELLGLLVLLGVFLAVVSPAGSKAVLTAWPVRDRGLPMGIRQTGVPIGALLAAAILPSLAPRIGVHAVFWGFAVVLLGTGWSFASVLPKTPPRSALHPKPTGVTRRELRRLLIPGVCNFLLGWSQYDLVTYSIPMLHGVYGLSLATAGFLLAVAQFGGILGRVGFGALSDRLGGRRDRVLAALSASATVLAVVLAVLPPHVPIAALFILWFCLGIGMVGWNALALTWSGESLPVEHAGVALSLSASCVMAGAVVAPPLYGRVVEASGRFQSGWLLLSAALLVATLLLMWSTRHSRPSPLTRRSEPRSTDTPPAVEVDTPR